MRPTTAQKFCRRLQMDLLVTDADLRYVFPMSRKPTGYKEVRVTRGQVETISVTKDDEVRTEEFDILPLPEKIDGETWYYKTSMDDMRLNCVHRNAVKTTVKTPNTTPEFVEDLTRGK
ncbi:unnamed protein product, partial [Mesorhabditis spiculigera]